MTVAIDTSLVRIVVVVPSRSSVTFVNWTFVGAEVPNVAILWFWMEKCRVIRMASRDFAIAVLRKGLHFMVTLEAVLAESFFANELYSLFHRLLLELVQVNQ